METVYLVTGAAGHLGRTLVQKLIARGEKVRALILPDDRNPPVGTEIFRGDVRHRESLRAFFHCSADECPVVIHCAGIVSISSKHDANVYDVNVTGTANVVALCQETGVKKLVHVSSVHAIPELTAGRAMTEIQDFHREDVKGLYARTKAEATAGVLAAAREGLSACVVHPSGLLGPGNYGHEQMTAMIIDCCRERLPASIRGGYDFVDVRDVANGILSCFDRGRPGECYILSGHYCEVGELMEMLHQIHGCRRVKAVFPAWVAKVAAPLAETYCALLRRPQLLTRYSIDVLTGNGHFSHAKASEELGYSPRALELTMRDTVTWLRDIGRI